MINEIKLDPFEVVLERFKAGQPVLLIDDAERENEGDVCVAAEAVTPDVIAFLMREARGLICVSLSAELASELRLPYQVDTNNSPFQTPFAVSIDATTVAQSGVTASSRAATVRALIAPEAKAEDFVSPGHIFPLIANQAGVLARQGHTEGTFDLARLSGWQPAGVLCEVLNPDGTMARGADLTRFANRHNLAVTSIAAIREYRLRHEVGVRKISSSRVTTDHGDFTALLFVDDAGQKEHVAMVKGDLSSMPASYAPLVRLHSECLTGDVFGSRRCDCGAQLADTLSLIESEGVGIVLYLRQEGRGIGLENKLRAYALQDQGLDTVEANLELGFKADERDFAVAAHMLRALGVGRVRLVTNNPRKTAALAALGIEVEQRVPMITKPDQHSQQYLATKRDKLGHLL